MTSHQNYEVTTRKLMWLVASHYQSLLPITANLSSDPFSTRLILVFAITINRCQDMPITTGCYYQHIFGHYLVESINYQPCNDSPVLDYKP